MKELKVLQSTSLRELVIQINQMGLQKDDILTLIKNDETFLLLYFK